MYLSEIGDRAARRIDMTPLTRLFTDNLRRLFSVIEHYGFKVRIIGGAVRNVLIGLPPRDIDMITDALPDQIMYILEKAKIHYITKGIPHGTVKVKFGGEEEYEVTSLAYEIEDKCCPEKLVIHSNQSWEGDAKRRDFTVDALSVDLDGHLYDYTGGIEDLGNRFVRFIGDPAEQIKKDPVLILRFFKLLSLFRNPKFDFSVIPIIRDHMTKIKRLKPKRIALELSNIQKSPNAERALNMMQSIGIMDLIKELQSVDEHLERYKYQDRLRSLLENIPDHLVPAVRLLCSNGQVKIVCGNSGETHRHILAGIGAQLTEQAAQINGGFFDLTSHRYLSRREALYHLGL